MKGHVVFIQRLSENIKELIISGNIHQLNLSFLDVVPDEMLPNLDMLFFGVLNWILSNNNSIGFITSNMSLEKLKTIVKKLILNPKDLSTISPKGNIFKFNSGTHNRPLFLARLANQYVTQKLTATRSTFSI